MSSIHSQKASGEVGAKHSLHLKDSVKSIRETAGKKPISKTPGLEPKGGLTQPNGVKELKRDLATGRALVNDGGSCLRCTEKGLNCTLNFLGVETVDRCAACKRSGAQYCIRQRPVEKLISFRGPPWCNPNYFCVGDEPSPEEMEEILREHFEGQETYCNGEYMTEKDRKGLALPPFNGSDLPLEERMENWKTADWERVLPIWKNASYYKDAQGFSGDKSPSGEQDEKQPYVSQNTLNYFRILRKYKPRNIHLQEYTKDLGETW
ncbi:uncharacterized protein F4807DRAFT_471563 [Annulohypoxylon truncatum]|uniref:uncharacterized protein n=1 Tax=Annulohypoxylon truncatum TaxID=327061 RepID=UPI002007D006|nr:uncharacterized protein F4807DRAFT_471563 [Annulohypoxylon truncatum]KAI1213070.1 hypothetical protein F4807DRAFT_471563 [Annulohypoxylon truncatum]